MPPQPSFNDSLLWETSIHLPEPSGEDTTTLLGKGYQLPLQHDLDVVPASRKRSNKDISNSGKKRKTTYDVRREQKVELTAQAEELQKQLDELKFRVLVEHGEAAKCNERVAAGNAVLQEFIQQQHLELAKCRQCLPDTRGKSLTFSQQQNVDSLHPAQTMIRLGKDPTERHNVLAALKGKKLQEAKRFITTRSQGLDPRSSYTQEERNHSDTFCQVNFENMIVKGASAREVFDAFIDVSQNAESSFPRYKRDISQMRLMTSTTLGTVVESNSVMVAEFKEAKDDQDESCGVIVTDFVDSDELYPYKPEERVRRDATSVFMIRSFKDSDNKELLVVATRWVCFKIRGGESNLSADPLQELQESTVSFGGTMKKSIQQRLGNVNLYDE
ncbi:hypothetical protein F444_17950 [Phytophthora nicotianae P1976]|uniref:START domain-containing protein n=1 Tax=Phytophthora nicotianae P1976 TaxID=1317066 RepID=A0A080ZD31_PHYNI|nr:hypothetical protein F444_17950 [Phytophthora nicotianae P1976]